MKIMRKKCQKKLSYLDYKYKPYDPDNYFYEIVSIFSFIISIFLMYIHSIEIGF